MVTQKKRCPHFLCHRVTTENLVKPYPQARQKLERNETHNIKLDGKNRMELNGNERGAYKHRPSEQNQRHYNEHRAATDMNRIMLYSRLKFKPQSKLRKYLFRKTGIKNHVISSRK